jgi:Ca-activated chloride channel family protein
MMPKLASRCAVILCLCLAASFVPPAGAADLVLVLDASGSMWGQIEGENKIVIARRVLGDLIDGLPEGGRVGLIAYGHRSEGDCNDIETVVPLSPLDGSKLKATIDGLNPKGKTPITRSVEQAFDVARGGEGGATVILVSDGLETCGGDPCAAVRGAKHAGLDFILHVVGFDVSGEDTSQLECAAQAGGGLFLAADNADQLSAALDTAVALAPDVPAGRLLVKAVANGALQDVQVSVRHAASGLDAGGGRTYSAPETNPRSIPLADGVYDVEVKAIRLEGDVVRRFPAVEIRDGGSVEKVVDYSVGDLAVGVTRNGALSDATVNVTVGGTSDRVAGGRSYTSETHNPKVMRLTAGTYDVEVRSVEIAGDVRRSTTGVVVPPQGRVQVDYALESGTLRIGVQRSGKLVDATVHVHDAATGRSVDGGRAYADPQSNPRAFVVPPGSYMVRVQEIRGERGEMSVAVGAGEEVTRVIDLDAGN